MKTVLAAAALLAPTALAPLAVTGPADAFQRNSVPTTFTLDHSTTTFPKSGYYAPIHGNLMGANGKVPDTAIVLCQGYRVEGWYGPLKGGATIDPVTGDFTFNFYTPATGHYVWSCGWKGQYSWTIYQGSGDNITLTITEPSAG